MNEMVNLISTCIVSSKKSYSRMILLNSEKQCIYKMYMYRGRRGGRRRRRRRRAAAVAEEEEKVSLGVIMTNTEIFHIFHIISLFNLHFFYIFQIFSLFNFPFFHNFHIISPFNLLFFHIFPYHFTIQPTFLP